MTKAEMIEKIASDSGISKAAAAKAYDSFLGCIKGGLKTRGSKVKANIPKTICSLESVTSLASR